MRKLLTSAALISLLAAPALAQHEGHRGGGDRGGPQGGPPPAAAPAAPAPAAPSGPITRGNAWQHRAPAAQPAAPAQAPQAAAPAAQPSRDFNRGGDRHDGRGNDNNRGNDRHDWNGRPGDNSRPGNANNNRPDWNHDGRPDNRPGWNGNNRPGNPGYRPGGRPDYSGFRDYHRNFNASRRFRAPSYHRPSGWYYRRWTFGQILPSLFWAQQYWLNDYISYDLPPPPPGAVWVRYGNDAILIDRYSGEIITVEYDVFY